MSNSLHRDVTVKKMPGPRIGDMLQFASKLRRPPHRKALKYCLSMGRAPSEDRVGIKQRQHGAIVIYQCRRLGQIAPGIRFGALGHKISSKRLVSLSPKQYTLKARQRAQ